MSALDAALGARKVVIEVPAAGVEDWVAVAELLVQEGLSAWALPPALIACLPGVVALFGRRARVGVTGLTDAADVRRAVDAGAHFLLAPIACPSLAEAAGDVPLVQGGLTPTEIAAVARAGAGAGAAAVMVAPADALGTTYARTLPALFSNVALLASGRLEHYQCAMWLGAGARAVLVSEVVLRTAGGNALDQVADRALSFRSVLSENGC